MLELGRQGSREIDLCDRAASDHVSCREGHDITRCPGIRYTTASLFLAGASENISEGKWFTRLVVRDILPASSRRHRQALLRTDETRLQEQWLGANQAQ